MPEFPITPAVLSASSGSVAEFAPDHFAGTLIRANVPPNLAFNAATVVHGILHGAALVEGRPTTTTDELRAATGEVVANPAGFDAGVLARILMRRSIEAAGPKGAAKRAALGPREAFDQVVGSVAAERAVGLQMLGLDYLEVVQANGARIEQYLAFGRDLEGAVLEFAEGPVHSLKPLGFQGPERILPGGGLGLVPISQVFQRLEAIHGVWGLSASGPQVRSASLVNVAPGLFGRPLYICATVTPAAAFFACVDATTGMLVCLMQPPMIGVLLPPIIFAGFWGAAWDVLCKIMSIVGMCIMIDGIAAGGLISAPTLAGPAAAAIGITALVLAIAMKLCDILMELFGPDKVKPLLDRMKAHAKEIEDIKKGVEDGSLDKDKTKDRLKKLGDDFRETQKQVKDFVEKNGDPVGGALGEGCAKLGEAVDALEKATSAVH